MPLAGKDFAIPEPGVPVSIWQAVMKLVGPFALNRRASNPGARSEGQSPNGSGRSHGDDVAETGSTGVLRVTGALRHVRVPSRQSPVLAAHAAF